MGSTDNIYNFAKALDCDARKSEPMSRHTTFKIGGKADAYIKVTSLARILYCSATEAMCLFLMKE